jgi:hypothetical protein
VTPRLAVVPELESELDDLFGRPLSEFTGARNELAKRLRKAGQDEAASRVQALKKPSVPVWTVNQLARRHPEEVRALVDAGARLRQTQEAAFRDEGGRAALREATAAEREAARMLTRMAHELLDDEGRPATRAVTDRIGGLLRSAAITPEAAETLAAGRLTEETATSGFETLVGLEIPKGAPRKAAVKPKPTDRRREQRLQRLRDRFDELGEAARAAEDEAETAERAARKARAAAERARAAADRAEAELQRAETNDA